MNKVKLILAIIDGDAELLKRALLIERFLKRIVKRENGCWEWSGYRQRDGYGRITMKGKSVYPHRVAWELFNGLIPKDLIVCHRCDNPPCANPDHLFLGTYSDNSRDREIKGRSNRRKGIRHGMVKLTESQVRSIKDLRTIGVRAVDIASQFNINEHHVRKIVRGMAWKHLD